MIQVDFSTTSEGLKYIRNFDLKKLVKVSAVKNGANAKVNFVFTSNTVTVNGAFNIGYRGEGSSGLYNVMTEAGFQKEVAEVVFIPSISSFEVEKVV